MASPKKKTKAKSMSEVSATALEHDRIKRKKIPARVHQMEIPGSQFYTYLNELAEEEIGPPEEGFQRSITFVTVPEKGVLELTVFDTVPEEVSPAETVN